MGKLLYQGHGSFRLSADNGTVIYIDPYAGTGYEVPADAVLVTHQHGDHNRTGKPAKKDGCRVIESFDILKNGVYGEADVNGVHIKAVPAENRNHSRARCVGFMVDIDGKKLYFAGDTSKIPEMSDYAALGIAYAFLPIDGIFNMGAEEASECARLIGAAHTVPVHTDPASIFNRKKAEAFHCEGRLIIDAGEEITL